MIKKLKSISLVLTCVFCLTAISFAQQETGQIIGTVTDPNGAVIANATVTVKNVDNGRETTIQTSEDGSYVIPNLQPAIYEVTVAAQNFQNKTERIQVTVGSKLTFNTQLGITATSNVVDVVAGGLAEVNTTDQQLSNVVTGKQITELPTLTRNPYDLVTTAGNVSEGDLNPLGASGRGAGVNINGQRSASTSILLDGAENVDNFIAGIGQQTPLDSVGEFRVITSNFSAEYGRASGGIVNVVTKSGTNRYSGTLYEFNRNSALASNSFDNNARGIERSNFNRNQFGYAIGGPLPFLNFGEGGPVFTSGKDKLFFFNSTEWTRVRSSAAVTAFVPTQAFINASNVNTRNFFAQYGT
ncbi:MAG: carboxypeptidase regulatory-like domain-containing protein, partial [Acidobacteriota bacterium]|nr:carboxypeptidase regulatory-like domain-containing protein [Acidobacteriota bacterium]